MTDDELVLLASGLMLASKEPVSRQGHLMDSISNKLLDLHDDVTRRNAVAFRMHVHEPARRGLHDDVLDALTRESWSTGFGEDVWKQLAERLAAVSQTYDSEIRVRRPPAPLGLTGNAAIR